MSDQQAIKLLTPDYFKDFVRSVKFRGADFYVVDLSDGRRFLAIDLETRERDSGEPTTLSMRKEVPPHPMTKDWMVHFVHNALYTMWVHELNEQYMVDGVRVFDPHREWADL